MRIHESFLKHRKRAIILAVIGFAALILIGGYVWMSYLAWQSNDRTVSSSKNEVSTLVDAILYDGNISNDSRHAKIAQLSTKKVTNLCKVSALYSWQRSVIGSLEATLKDCDVNKGRIETVVSQTNSLQRYGSDEKKITQQLGKLKPAKDTLAPTDIQKMLDTVSQVQNQIKSASLASQEGKELRKLSDEILTETISSWTTLKGASEKQDRNAYEAEIVKLSGIYGRFIEVSTLASNTYQKLIASLQLSSNALTK